MIRIRQPEALALVREHFRPLLFTATMDSPQTIQAMLLDELTGESLVLTGLPCGVSVTRAQLAGLISLIELDVAALSPALLKRSRERQIAI
ncbi:DUF1652 domain-containing protein [Pseudomonas sp. KSR10]|jgi:hypothetical protein|uniref:DUF1652 domain-containing protein n=1 Tax=Stutzerimonas stutzeri TaxID=316 RepID=A0A0D9AU12_STUST|nr:MULTISPECIES: DUF1652 domain-containing protein [Pseudomonadaceae]KJH82871.1 hypothetical protein UF78_08520 [Stutzerimonas stutzeri]MCG6542628.1 DUF1652 domain-containing protein [Pseudomonas sp. KSR10]